MITPVVASIVPGKSQPPSCARVRRDATKEGNMDVPPSYMSSNIANIGAYAAAPEQEDRSNASEDVKGSKTRSGCCAALDITLIILTNNAIAAVRLVASVMSFWTRDLFRFWMFWSDGH